MEKPEASLAGGIPDARRQPGDVAASARRGPNERRIMRRMNEEPRLGSLMQLLMVLAIVLSAKVDTITANVICLILTVWAMWEQHAKDRE